MQYDHYNPIFVLHYQRTFRTLRRFEVLLPLLALVSAAGVLVRLGISQGYDWETLSIYLSLLGLCGFFCAMFPGISLSRRVMNQDLLHCTPMSNRQIIRGYVLNGAFSNAFLCVCGFVILACTLPGTGLFRIALLDVILIFLGTETLAICLLPFFAIIEKPYQYIGLIPGGTVLTIYAGCVMSCFFIATYNGSLLAGTLAFVLLTLAASYLGYFTAWDCMSWFDETFFKKSVSILTRYVLAILVVFGGFWGVWLLGMGLLYIVSL